MGKISRDIQGITAFNNSIAVERMLARFGWLGDPDEILQRAGISRVRLRRVAADDEVAAVFDTRRDTCINTPWRIEHPSARARKFFTGVLEPHMPELAQQVWYSILYGYSVLELVYRAPAWPRYGPRPAPELPRRSHSGPAPRERVLPELSPAEPGALYARFLDSMGEQAVSFPVKQTLQK